MTIRESLTYEPAELSFGTSGLRALVTDMTDLECYINTVGFLRFQASLGGLQQDSAILVGGDLRDSTPRIVSAVVQASIDNGFTPVNCGLLPTPAIAYYGMQMNAPCIMVTGSHIPADRNGIKFYKSNGEVLKDDEAAIKQAVAEVRTEIYATDATTGLFDPSGSLKLLPAVPDAIPDAITAYKERYLSSFGDKPLTGKQIVFYQHSAVGRDLLAALLESLGATVKTVGRSDIFIPIDTENVTPENQAYFHQLAQENAGCFAIVSTDGDSDRPFVIDEKGVFHRGDVLGAIVAKWCNADFAAFPISSSDAVDSYMQSSGIPFRHTKIGSPYVIKAMQESSDCNRIVGWEVNGGFLIGDALSLPNGTLKPLPTRDAFFPILVALLSAIDQDIAVSQIFDDLPPRYTQAGLINNFPVETSQTIIKRFSDDTPEVRQQLERYFTPLLGYGSISQINPLDGVRIFFANGDIAHLRPSGNAPQLRIYSVASTQERADQIVAQALAEPSGIFRTIAADLKKEEIE